MELILDKNKKKEHLYLEVFHYYRELIFTIVYPLPTRRERISFLINLVF